MKTDKIVIFGSSGHAKVIVDVVESNSSLKLLGFIDRPELVGSEVLGYKVIGSESSLPELMDRLGFSKGIIGIGDNSTRRLVATRIQEIAPTFEFTNCIHKSANISRHCEIGHGNVIMPGVSINASSIVSNHCILNTHSSLDHDSLMEPYSSLGPNAATGGNCSIGELSHIGIGASILQRVSIGRNCIIGAGSLVNKDTKNDSVYYGSPAIFISKRKAGDQYLKSPHGTN